MDRGRPDFAQPAAFSRPGLDPAEAGLVEGDDEIVAGRRPVEEAFVARREARRLLVVPQRRSALEKLVLHATSLRIPIVEVEGGSLNALTGFDGHQGIALVVAPRRYASVADILARAIERNEAPFVLVLDSLEDPQNVGTLLRSAEAAGAHGVLFPTRRQAPLSPAAVKASAGAVEHLLLAPVDDLAGALADLHIAGLRVVGAEADAALTVREADLRGPLALVVGSEGQGLGPAVRRRCDLMVRIPMRGVIGSLNASVAGSILLFEATTQRGGSETPPVLKVRTALPAVPRPSSTPRADAEAVAAAELAVAVEEAVLDEAVDHEAGLASGVEAVAAGIAEAPSAPGRSKATKHVRAEATVEAGGPATGATTPKQPKAPKAATTGSTPAPTVKAPARVKATPTAKASKATAAVTTATAKAIQATAAGATLTAKATPDARARPTATAKATPDAKARPTATAKATPDAKARPTATAKATARATKASLKSAKTAAKADAKAATKSSAKAAKSTTASTKATKSAARTPKARKSAPASASATDPNEDLLP